MDSSLLFSICLLMIGLALVLLEVFVPSGGLIGVMAGLALIASLVLAFNHGPASGMAVILAILVGVPTCVITGLKYWPHTRMGKRILLTAPRSEDVLPDDPVRRRMKSLVGHVGKARSKMLPAGAVLIDGETFDAVTEGMAVEPGQWVRVIEVRGNRMVVRPTDDPALAADRPVDLDRPVDQVTGEPFTDPFES